MSTAPHLKLVTRFTPAHDGQPLSYGIELTNLGSAPLAQFQLGINGPARIDPETIVEGGTLIERLSNHSLFAPPAGFVLEPGATWAIVTRGLSYPLRHWTDGATAAYVVLADGSTAHVETEPTEMVGANAPLLRGAAALPDARQGPGADLGHPLAQARCCERRPCRPCGSGPQARRCRCRAGGQSLRKTHRRSVSRRGHRALRGRRRHAGADRLEVWPQAGRLRDRLHRERSSDQRQHPRRSALWSHHRRPDPAGRQAISRSAHLPDGRHHRG